MRNASICGVGFFVLGILSKTSLFALDANTSSASGTLDLMKVYEGCPWIYTILLMMSLASVTIWLYSLFTLRASDLLPGEFLNHIRELLKSKHYEEALATCQQEQNFSSGVIASGLASRKLGPHMMLETMQSEGKRSGVKLWQRITFLNEIAFVAPLLGLLGTVLGLFFAFYDTNRTPESLTAIFDGLGIAVGTTVAGLLVAILAMFFASILKYRLVNLLNSAERELLALIPLIETPHSDR